MNQEKKGFGTFGGVFIPNILTILGVIMYLRMGWVVGNAGLYHTLIILGIANVITLFTSFSMSSVATNMRVRGGGAYFMISRSLGAEVGGSVGIPLYLAQTLGISLYIVGFAESVNRIFPELNVLFITLPALLVMTTIALISSNLVVKTQYIIFAVIIISLISFFSGRPLSFESMHLQANYSEGYDFWAVFAVFFPAVTGILSGVSLSGDLRDPSRSIPSGTLISVGIGAAVYLLIAIWFSLVAGPDELINNNTLMIGIARWGPLVYAGIWGATLSSALANILAAPRTLQALAKDGIFFRLFARGRGKTNDPVPATIFSCLIVAGVLLVGELNTIAPVLTMFFLITYGSLNLISFAEHVIKRPGFRPTFRVHWSFSLLGAAGCIWIMFVINPLACIVGFTVVFAIYLFLKRIQLQRNWGDVRSGIWSAVVHYSLMQMENLEDHPSTWRPNLLLLGSNVTGKRKLLETAFSLTRKSGFLTVLNLFREKENDTGDLEDQEATFREILRKRRTHAFFRNVLIDDFSSAQMIASQIHGIGDFRHNTILTEWTASEGRSILRPDKEGKDQFRLIRLFRELNYSVLLYQSSDLADKKDRAIRNIDVWWDPRQDNGSFMLLLAHLMASSTLFDDPVVTLKTVVLRQKMEQTRSLLLELIEKSRIKANIQVLYPDSLEEAELSFQYDKTVRKKMRQSEWSERIRRWFDSIAEEPDSADKREETVPENEQAGESDKSERDESKEDDEIKERISEQMKDRDAFIIDKKISNIIADGSQEADLVMLGFNIPTEGNEKRYIEKMASLLEKLPDAILVHCPFDVELFT